MNHGVVICEAHFNLLFFEEFFEVGPVVLLLFKFEAIVKLVHLYVLRVVATENFSVDPTVAQISLRVRHLVSQVQ